MKHPSAFAEVSGSGLGTTHDRDAPKLAQGVHSLPEWGVGRAGCGEEEAKSKPENKTQSHTLTKHTLSNTEAC